jgi:hypothetical protein
MNETATNAEEDAALNHAPSEKELKDYSSKL